MHRSWGWKHQQYGWRPRHHSYRGWSPWMGIGFLIVLFLIFSKGLFWPLLFIFLGVMLLKGGRHGWQWMGCEDEGPEGKAKRKNEEYIIIIDDEQPKRKNGHGDEDPETVYYL